MKIIKVLVLVMAMVSVNVFATDIVVSQLQDVSVTIHSASGEGSGVLVTRSGVSFVMTAAHVVDSARQVRKVVNPKDGSSRYIVTFDPVLVMKDVYEGDRMVGTIILTADVIKFSDVDYGEDVAILKVRKTGMLPQVSTKFYNDSTLLPIGTKLLHVGSMLGHRGSNSFTTGVLSQVGRIEEGKMFYQTSTVACAGSSGCGIFLEDGRYVGMLVRGYPRVIGFGLFTPVQRIQAWAKKTNISWIFDETLPVTPFGDIELVEDESPIVEATPAPVAPLPEKRDTNNNNKNEAVLLNN